MLVIVLAHRLSLMVTDLKPVEEAVRTFAEPIWYTNLVLYAYSLSRQFSVGYLVSTSHGCSVTAHSRHINLGCHVLACTPNDVACVLRTCLS